MVLALAWLFGSATAAPLFSAMDPAHAEIARTAWSAAITCTGWEAPAHAVVQIRQGYVAGGFSGGAFLDDDGLYRIDIGLDMVSRSLVHEVAHAWAHTGSAALTEGRADLLADCIVSRNPHLAPLDPDPGTGLDAMPDLRRWANPHGDHGLVDIDAYRRDAYLGAARWMRVLATVIEPRRLWPESGALRWRDVERMLEDAGPEGAILLAVLDGGVERQRAALSDRDRDGVPWLAEILQGTNPDRWDSDGDGWWDGASAPPSVAAVPVPLDGTPVCVGLAAGRSGGTVQVVTSGELRGAPLPYLVLRGGGDVLVGEPRAGVVAPPHRPLLVAMSGPVERSTGGVWALAGGQGLVDTEACRSTPSLTVWADDPAAEPVVAAFAGEVDQHLRRAEALLGRPPQRRIEVVLGAAAAGVDGATVRLTMGQVRWAIDHERLDALAGLAVAVHHIWEADRDRRRWDTAEGLARAIVDNPPDLAFVSADLRDAERVVGEAERCDKGWPGVIDGTCR